MLAEIVQALIFKYHKVYIEFPVDKLVAALPTNPESHQRIYGELYNGMLGLEMLFMYRSDSIFKVRYYTDHIEFQRKLMNIDSYISRNKVDMDTYQYLFTNGTLRDGIEVKPFNTKITYKKIF